MKTDRLTKLQNLTSIKDIAANAGVQVEIEGKIASIKDIKVKAKDEMYKKQECVFTDCGNESYRLVAWEEP